MWIGVPRLAPREALRLGNSAGRLAPFSAEGFKGVAKIPLQGSGGTYQLAGISPQVCQRCVLISMAL